MGEGNLRVVAHESPRLGRVHDGRGLGGGGNDRDRTCDILRVKQALSR